MNQASRSTSGGPPSAQGDSGSSTFVLAPRRISPSTACGGRKRHNHSSNNGGGGGKRRKVDAMDVDPIFPKLNQSDPVHAKRIQARRRTVQMGKNTPGYAEYTRTVPQHERRLRSMDTPSTPDHTLDIPNKRWQGIVKAWRRALHNYDPPDLTSAFQKVAPQQQQPRPATNNTTVQSRQIEDAVARGLLVDFLQDKDPNNKARDNDNCSPISILTEESTQSGSQNFMDLEEWNEVEPTGGLGGDDDSDDELL